MAYGRAIAVIAAYQALSLATYAYGHISLQRAAPQLQWDNVNHRTPANRTAFEKAVPRSTFHRWERCIGAHTNMNENLGFVVGALVAGFIGGLDPDFLNKIMTIYLATRIGYVIVYVSFAELPWGALRPMFWWSGTLTLFYIYWHAVTTKQAGI